VRLAHRLALMVWIVGMTVGSFWINGWAVVAWIGLAAVGGAVLGRALDAEVRAQRRDRER
jgi:hypothetical protein